jgi:hypothetical protein
MICEKCGAPIDQLRAGVGAPAESEDFHHFKSAGTHAVVDGFYYVARDGHDAVPAVNASEQAGLHPGAQHPC